MIRTALIALACIGAVGCATAEAPRTETSEIAGNRQEERDIDALNSIASIVIDSAALYREAAQLADGSGVRDELNRFAEQHDRLAADLQTEITRRGGVPTESGKALGFGHRVFADIRTVFADDDKVATREVVRAERYLVDEMQEAINNPEVSAGAQAFLRSRLPTVEAIHNQAVTLARANGADV